MNWNVHPGCKPAVLVQVAIHREVEKISPYTAIIEERVPFAWRPVAAESRAQFLH